MDPYTHAVLAQTLEPVIRPADPADYLWGAVAADIRYLAGMRREITHRPDAEVAAWGARYPGCASFIQGYRVHCLLDRIDTVQVVGGAFPLWLLLKLRRRPFSAQQMTAMIGLYYQKTFPQGLTLVGGHNPILAELGIREEQVAGFIDALAGHLAQPAFETAIACFRKLGILDDARIEKYMDAYHKMTANRLLLWALMAGVKNAHLERIAEREVIRMPPFQAEPFVG